MEANPIKEFKVYLEEDEIYVLEGFLWELYRNNGPQISLEQLIQYIVHNSCRLAVVGIIDPQFLEGKTAKDLVKDEALRLAEKFNIETG